MNQQSSKPLAEKVLQTALQLFSEKGYFSTSIQDIKREAGVSTGAIYHHFQNKEQIAQSLYQSLMERIENEMLPILDENKDCLTRCHKLIQLLFKMAEKEPKMMQFILLAKHKEYLPNEVPICSSRPFLMMRSVLEQGMLSGEVRQMEPWVAATAMFGGALRMTNLYLDGVLEQPLDSYLDAIVDCGWRAVKVDE